MRMLRRLKVDLKRMCANGHLFWVCTGNIFFGIVAISTSQDIEKMYSVSYYMEQLVLKHIYLISFILSFFAYGCCFIDDWDYQYIRQDMLMGNLTGYVLSKTFWIFISSIVVMGTQAIGCCYLLRLFMPWGNLEEIMNISKTPYAKMAEYGNVPLFFLLIGLQMGLLSGILSLFAAFFSLFVHNKIFCATTTFLISMIMQFIGVKVANFNLYQMYIGIMNYSFQGNYWIQKAVLLSISGYIFCSILIYAKIRWRIHHE